MKQYITIILLLGWCWSCQDPVSRKPIHQKNDHSLRVSIQRNKAIIASQQKLIEQAIQEDSVNLYTSSPAGYWFSKIKANESPKPVTGDEVTFTFEIQTLDGEILYEQKELGTINYLVDKEELLPGLRYAVKDLGENEKGIFLIPSYLGYGYQGDGEKIGINQPLRLVVELKNIRRRKPLEESK